MGRAALAGVLGASLSGCGKPLEQAECDKLLDHYVELLLRNEQPDVPFHEQTTKQTQARSKAATDPQFAQCSQESSRRQFDCAMAATNPDILEQCLVF